MATRVCEGSWEYVMKLKEWRLEVYWLSKRCNLQERWVWPCAPGSRLDIEEEWTGIEACYEVKSSLNTIGMCSLRSILSLGLNFASYKGPEFEVACAVSVEAAPVLTLHHSWWNIKVGICKAIIDRLWQIWDAWTTERPDSAFRQSWIAKAWASLVFNGDAIAIAWVFYVGHWMGNSVIGGLGIKPESGVKSLVFDPDDVKPKKRRVNAWLAVRRCAGS